MTAESGREVPLDPGRSRSATFEAKQRREASTIRKLPGSRWREDEVTSALASLLILGLFLDGWNHINLQDGKLGGFFTPWHGLLYFGFSATALWVVACNAHLFRGTPPRPGARELLGIPLRYPLAVAGIAVATVGLVGDLAWHSAFGEEEGVARVIGPFHILLFTGAGLLVTGSFRSAWQSLEDYPVAPSLRTMLPPLISLTLVTAMAAFLFQWLSAFLEWSPSIQIDRIPAGIGEERSVEETVELAGAARVVVTNLILMAPLLFALRRWRLPFGSVTLMFTTVATLMAALAEFRLGWSIAAAITGGLTADLLIRRLRASPLRPAGHRIIATVTPLVMWSVYFVALAVGHDIAWPRDLALGTVGLTGLTGLVLSVLILPPALPDGAWVSADERGTPRP